jgi:hypothetical protein
MTLREKQSRFVLMTADLIRFADSAGYELTFGDAWAKTGHMDGSKHYDRLAIDLNLFLYGRFLTDTNDHYPLGEYWESLGGRWGGRWNDGNHYEYGD